MATTLGNSTAFFWSTPSMTTATTKYQWVVSAKSTCTACIDDYQIAYETNDWKGTKACYRAYVAFSNCKGTATISDVVRWYTDDAETTGIRVPSTVFQSWRIGMEEFYGRSKDRTPQELGGRLRDIIAARSAPAAHVRRRDEKQPLPETTDLRELRARQTLRKLVGDRQYQQLLRWGYLTVQGPSGKWYNLKPGYANAAVYENGKQVNNLCIQLSGDFPPTDSLIMRVMMVWNDEESLWKIANKSGVYYSERTFKMPDQRPLTEILGDLRTRYPNVPVLAAKSA